MSDIEEILNEDDKLSLGNILKDMVLKKCYIHPDKTFNDIFIKIKQEIFNIDFQRHYNIEESQTFRGWVQSDGLSKISYT